MFTGIIQALGNIEAFEHRAGDARLRVRAEDFCGDQMAMGDSISVNGVCLTVVEYDDSNFCADVSCETLSRTTLQSLRVNSSVNLEKALTPSSPIGGHFVSGHVDGVGYLKSKDMNGRSQVLRFEAPAGLAKYIAEKGSICIDGISLTVNQVNGVLFEVNIVPHTLKVTTLGRIVVEQRVNLEVDLIARYLESLMLGRQTENGTNRLNHDTLKKAGFL